jgi:hypothetical protein
MDDNRFKKLIVKTLLLLILSIVVGIFIPGFINYQNNSFSKQDIFNRLDSTKQKKILANNLQKETIKKRKADLLQVIKDTTQKISSQQIKETEEAIQSLNKIEDLTNDNSISLSPFYPKSKLLLLWPFLYFGLSVLAFLVRPKYSYKINKKLFWTTLILLTVFVRWPTWMRNTFIGQIDRVVYSISNYDISKVSFFLQEFQSLLSLMLLTIIICKWLSYAENLRHKLLTNTKFSELYFLKIVKDLRSVYQEWQLCSLFLALSFGYYTYYFWATIHETNDYRYLPHAIIIHVVWGLTWFVISLPLITIKNYQLNFKENFLRQQISPTLTTTINKDTINLILNEDPISSQNQTITALISGATFLLPIIKAFL